MSVLLIHCPQVRQANLEEVFTQEDVFTVGNEKHTKNF